MAECELSTCSQTASYQIVGPATLQTKRSFAQGASPTRLLSTSSSQRLAATAPEAPSETGTRANTSTKFLEAQLPASAENSPPLASSCKLGDIKVFQPPADAEAVVIHREKIHLGEPEVPANKNSLDGKHNVCAANRFNQRISKVDQSNPKRKDSSDATRGNKGGCKADLGISDIVTTEGIVMRKNAHSSHGLSLETGESVSVLGKEAPQGSQYSEQTLQAYQNESNHRMHPLWRETTEGQDSQVQQSEWGRHSKPPVYEESRELRPRSREVAASAEAQGCSAEKAVRANPSGETVKSPPYWCRNGTTYDSSVARSVCYSPAECPRQKHSDVHFRTQHSRDPEREDVGEETGSSARAQHKKQRSTLFEGAQTSLAVNKSVQLASKPQNALQRRPNFTNTSLDATYMADDQKKENKQDPADSARSRRGDKEASASNRQAGADGGCTRTEKYRYEEDVKTSESAINPGHGETEEQLMGFTRTLDHILDKLLQSRWTALRKRPTDPPASQPDEARVPSDAHRSGGVDLASSSSKTTDDGLDTFPPSDGWPVPEQELRNRNNAQTCGSFRVFKHGNLPVEGAKTLEWGAVAAVENDAGSQKNSAPQAVEQNRQQHEWSSRRQSDDRWSRLFTEEDLKPKSATSALLAESGVGRLLKPQRSSGALDTTTTQTEKAATALSNPVTSRNLASTASRRPNQEEAAVRRDGSLNENAVCSGYHAGGGEEVETQDSSLEDGESDCNLLLSGGGNDVGEAKRLQLVRHARMFPAVRGVYFDTRSGNLSWRCSWKVDGKKRSRSWSVLKFGMEGARAHAIAERLRQHSKSCHTDDVARDFLRCYSAGAGNVAACRQHVSVSPTIKGSSPCSIAQLKNTKNIPLCPGPAKGADADLSKSPSTTRGVQLHNSGASRQALAASTLSSAATQVHSLSGIPHQRIPLQVTSRLEEQPKSNDAESGKTTLEPSLPHAALSLRDSEGLSIPLKPPVSALLRNPAGFFSWQRNDVNDSREPTELPAHLDAGEACLTASGRPCAPDSQLCSSVAAPTSAPVRHMSEDTSNSTFVEESPNGSVCPNADHRPDEEDRRSAPRGNCLTRKHPSAGVIDSVRPRGESKDGISPSANVAVDETASTGEPARCLETDAKRRRLLSRHILHASSSPTADAASDHPSRAPEAAPTSPSAGPSVPADEHQQVSPSTKGLFREPDRNVSAEHLASSRQIPQHGFRQQRKGGSLTAEYGRETLHDPRAGQCDRHIIAANGGNSVTHEGSETARESHRTQARKEQSEKQEELQTENAVADDKTDLQLAETGELQRRTVIQEEYLADREKPGSSLQHQNANSPCEGTTQKESVLPPGEALISASEMLHKSIRASTLGGGEVAPLPHRLPCAAVVDKIGEVDMSDLAAPKVVDSCAAGVKMLTARAVENREVFTHLEKKRNRDSVVGQISRSSGSNAEYECSDTGEEDSRRNQEHSSREATARILKSDAPSTDLGAAASEGKTEHELPYGWCSEGSLQQQPPTAADETYGRHLRARTDEESDVVGPARQWRKTPNLGGAGGIKEADCSAESRLLQGDIRAPSHTSSESPSVRIQQHRKHTCAPDTSAGRNIHAKEKKVTKTVENALSYYVLPADAKTGNDNQQTRKCSGRLQSAVLLRTSELPAHIANFSSNILTLDISRHPASPAPASRSYSSQPTGVQQNVEGCDDEHEDGNSRGIAGHQEDKRCHEKLPAQAAGSLAATAAPRGGSKDNILGAVPTVLGEPSSAASKDSSLIGTVPVKRVESATSTAKAALEEIEGCERPTKNGLPFVWSDPKSASAPVERDEVQRCLYVARSADALSSACRDEWNSMSEEKTQAEPEICQRAGGESSIRDDDALQATGKWGNAAAVVSLELPEDVQKARYDGTPTTAPSPTPDDLVTDAGPILTGGTAILEKERSFVSPTGAPEGNAEEGVCLGSPPEALWRIWHNERLQHAAKSSSDCKPSKCPPAIGVPPLAERASENLRSAELEEDHGHRRADHRLSEEGTGNAKKDNASITGSARHNSGDPVKSSSNAHNDSAGTCNADTPSPGKIGGDGSPEVKRCCRFRLVETLLDLRGTLGELLEQSAGVVAVPPSQAPKRSATINLPHIWMFPPVAPRSSTPYGARQIAACSTNGRHTENECAPEERTVAWCVQTYNELVDTLRRNVERVCHEGGSQRSGLQAKEAPENKERTAAGRQERGTRTAGSVDALEKTVSLLLIGILGCDGLSLQTLPQYTRRAFLAAVITCFSNWKYQNR